eukprot:jgi/Astpho2/4297/gw1.00064.96.1_t
MATTRAQRSQKSLSSWPPTALAVPGGLQRRGGCHCTPSTGCQCTSSVWAVFMGQIEAR